MNCIDKDKLKDILSEEEFTVTQNKGTEPQFSGIYLNNHKTGVYRCICCDSDLFSSDIFEGRVISNPNINCFIVHKIKLLFSRNRFNNHHSGPFYRIQWIGRP